jgi:hypothetical protein
MLCLVAQACERRLEFLGPLIGAGAQRGRDHAPAAYFPEFECEEKYDAGERYQEYRKGDRHIT